MDVRCDQCGIIYEFEDERVGETGITVKCTSCDHIFKVFKAAAKTTEPASEPAAEKPAPVADPAPAADKKQGDRRWLIRKPSGEIFKFRELTTLQQWIVEQKVSREDEISRTGKVWERLGAIKELAPFFKVVDKARASEEDPQTPANMPNASEQMLAEAPLSKPAPARVDLLDDRAEPNGMPEKLIAEASEKFSMGERATPTSSEPAFPTGKIQVGTDAANKQAAWERDSDALDSVDESASSDSFDDEDLAAVRTGSHVGRNVLIVVLGLAIGLGGFFAWTKWDRIKELFSGKRNPTSGSFHKGRTAFHGDTDASFKRALSLFLQIYQSKSSQVTGAQRAKARAGQAEVYAAWAQYLKDDAEDLRADALLLEKGGVAGTPSKDPRPLRAKATRLDKDAKAKANLALRYARSAHLMAQNLETKRAVAEAGRVAGLPISEVQRLIKAAEQLGAADPELAYTRAMIAYDLGKLDETQKQLRSTIALWNQKVGKPFFRAQMRLARVYYMRARRPEAISVLQSITSRNPSHARAQHLLDKLKAGSKAVAVTKTVVDAGVPDSTVAVGVEPGMRPKSGGDEPAGNYDTLVRKAGQLAYSGKSSRALTYYRKALALKPSGVEALTGVGYCYMDLRQTGQAIRHFRRALGVSGSYGEALIGIAEAFQRSGSKKRALNSYKKYLRHHPSGRRAVLAKQNIKELEDKLGVGAMQPMDRPAPMVREPTPRVREPAPRVREPARRPPAMRRAPAMVSEPPPAMN